MKLWTLIGFIIRLILMPITTHGQDLTFINRFPMMFIKEGVWDVYQGEYGVVLYLIMLIPNFIFSKIGFTNLFLQKCPYLIFDFAIAVMLFKMAKEDKWINQRRKK